ncbi:MAG: hypothetical protein AABZ26_00215 [Chloroflexota bacterium]
MNSRNGGPGISYAVATYTATNAFPDRRSVTSRYDVYLVLEGERWKLWFTARR